MSDTPPPKFEDEMNEMPELEEGQTVEVETWAGYDSDRTLTVEAVGVEPEETDNLDITTDEPQVRLSGYGTEYRFAVDRSWTDKWQRVVLVWPSKPEGVSVSNVTVVDDE